MRIITLIVALVMVTSAVAQQERCGCNKPRPTTPKQVPAVKQQPVKPAAQPK